MNLTRISEEIELQQGKLLAKAKERAVTQSEIEYAFSRIGGAVASEAAHEAPSEAVGVYHSIMRQVAARLRKWTSHAGPSPVAWAVEKLERCATPDSGPVENTGTGKASFVVKLEFGGKPAEVALGVAHLEAPPTKKESGDYSLPLPRTIGETLDQQQRMIGLLITRRDKWRARAEKAEKSLFTPKPNFTPIHITVKPGASYYLAFNGKLVRLYVEGEESKNESRLQEQIETLQQMLLEKEHACSSGEAKVITELRNYVKIEMQPTEGMSYLSFLASWLPRSHKQLQRLKIDLAEYRQLLRCPGADREKTVSTISQLLSYREQLQEVLNMLTEQGAPIDNAFGYFKETLERWEQTRTDLLEQAWGIIANAGGGDWSKEHADWRGDALRFRDLYHQQPKSRKSEAKQVCL